MGKKMALAMKALRLARLKAERETIDRQIAVLESEITDAKFDYPLYTEVSHPDGSMSQIFDCFRSDRSKGKP